MSSSYRVKPKKSCKKKVSFLKLALQNMSRKNQSKENGDEYERINNFLQQITTLQAEIMELNQENAQLNQVNERLHGN